MGKHDVYIGEASKVTGASIKAIRFYEEVGLLNDVKRVGKYRVYNEDHLVLIRLIMKAKSLGFKLSELEDFTKQKDAGTLWDCILHLITNKTAQIESTIAELEKQKEELLNYKKAIVECLADSPDCSLNETVLDSTP